MNNWSEFIRNFYGVEILDDITCENGIGVPKIGTYSLKVFRCILKDNQWCDQNGPISEPYVAMCADSFNTLLLDQWVQSCVNSDATITYSYYMKVSSCNDVVTTPPFPTI
jgi:hypothetical protein